MEQTAVEWLKLEIDSIEFQDPAAGKLYIEIQSLIEQALAMEKEQIVQAHGNKQKTKSNPDSIVTFGYTYTGEMYYNQKYKGINPII